MAQRSIGQERFGFAGRRQTSSSLDELGKLIDWNSVAALLDPLYPAAKGEPAWPPVAMFRALLLSIWYDLSDVKLAEALDDRASFRRFCGFSANESTPERTAFVRFRRLMVVNRRSNGTPYRRVKGTPFVNSAMVVERGPCAARGAGRA